MTEGRYKNKGQGGKILAINIPSMEMALNVTTEMEKKLYEPRNLQGTGINGRKGRNRFIVTDVVVFPISMSALNVYFYLDDKSDIKSWAHPRLFVDYKGIEETPVKDEEIPAKNREILELLGKARRNFRGGGFMAEEYKNFIKVHPEMVKELTVDQRERVRRSDDMDEIIEILEEAHNVRIRE
jgi:hypothetical protein